MSPAQHRLVATGLRVQNPRERERDRETEREREREREVWEEFSLFHHRPLADYVSVMNHPYPLPSWLS